ncbi:sialidase family protein [Companilactobacillus nodensis]|uniref:Sialidase domain-containing protein n=1 Tax=Companilactobacillus nodensis DSM 19682 = JCM 14932 = NBRC 107160 TaxID=1423775 RepID=A0A0R1KB14_9LACO|nr:exo-alpha-sialidase [Companilactobacillus nodensis]KRK80886.1 hypothetical protein FD03_GL001021 [Companilactobacillus nodensis DSM 19682 = JCM 14932 = NBRC 107160]
MELQDSLTTKFERTFTLPKSGIQSHASNLLILDNGDTLCVWFSGTQEGMSDISIFLSRMNNGEETWSEPIRMSSNEGRSDQNPMLFHAPNGDIWLMYTSQDGGNQDTAIVEYRISHDEGKTWDDQKILFNGEQGVFIRQPIVVTDNGEWLLPIFHCVVKNDGKAWDGSYDYSTVRVSSDEFKTFKEYEVPNSLGCVHMDIEKLKSGRYIGLFRSRWADNIYRSYSEDGKTWSEPEKTELPNNNASIQATVLDDGDLVMVFNYSSAKDATSRRTSLYSDGLEDKDADEDSDVPRAFWGAPRAPITVAISEDEGKTWPFKKNIAEGDGYALTNDSKNKKNREFSYPSIKVAKNGNIDVTFTYFRQKIAFVELTEDWIKSEKTVNE